MAVLHWAATLACSLPRPPFPHFVFWLRHRLSAFSGMSPSPTPLIRVPRYCGLVLRHSVTCGAEFLASPGCICWCETLDCTCGLPGIWGMGLFARLPHIEPAHGTSSRVVGKQQSRGSVCLEEVQGVRHICAQVHKQACIQKRKYCESRSAYVAWHFKIKIGLYVTCC